MGLSASTIPVNNMAKVDHLSKYKIATFAMGCFWYPDGLFGCQKGVYRTRVGYTSGSLPNPTYRNLGDHTEAVEIDYDADVISYTNLLGLFWQNHNFTDSFKRQYRSAIFYRDEEEKQLAIDSKSEMEKKLGHKVSTAIEPFQIFYNAEDYHQKYYLQTYHQKLWKSLGIKQKDFINSEVAAKLNGYVVGLNTIESFNAECQCLGLSSENCDYVRQMIAKGKQAHC